jgi:hypothetical protein
MAEFIEAVETENLFENKQSVERSIFKRNNLITNLIDTLK